MPCYTFPRPPPSVPVMQASNYSRRPNPVANVAGGSMDVMLHGRPLVVSMLAVQCRYQGLASTNNHMGCGMGSIAARSEAMTGVASPAATDL
jgi:hypothetical protein